MKQRNRRYRLRTNRGTIHCRGWNDAVRLRRYFGGRILGR